MFGKQTSVAVRSVIRAAFLVLACGIAASTAGAAAPIARNDLIAFTSDRSDNLGKGEVYVVSSDGKGRTNVSRGTTSPDDEARPAWSPDGERIAFSGEEALVVVNTDGSSRELWNEGALREANYAPNWSPDGREIAVAGVWLVSTRTRQARRLTDGFDGEAIWSSDGTQLAFTRQIVEGELPDLYVVRRDGFGLRLLARRIDCCVSWSPRGHSLLYGSETGALFIVDARTGTRRQLKLGRLQVLSDSNAVWAPRGKWIAVPTGKGLYVFASNGRERRRIARRGNGTPAWSPTAKALAFVSSGGDVYTVSVETRRSRRIVRGRCRESVTHVSWSPDGEHIAFAASMEGENDTEIHTMRDDGSNLRRLTHNCSQYEREPAWSPDGKRLAYSTGHIFVMNRDGSRKQRLTRTKASDGSPSWSPDGRRIVFARSFFVRGNGTGLFTVRTDRLRSVRRLTRRSGMTNADPAWAPRGNKIAFVTTRAGGIPQIYVMRTDGAGATALTHGPLSSVNPAWSPDGTRLAFIRDSDVWTMNADGTNTVRLTAFWDLTEAEQPAWSPDGTKIVFSRDVDHGRGSQNALFVIESTGGEPRLLASANGSYTDPNWQATR